MIIYAKIKTQCASADVQNKEERRAKKRERKKAEALRLFELKQQKKKWKRKGH